MVFKSFRSKSKELDILTSIPDGVMLIDNTGKVQWENDVLPILLNLSKNKISKSNINEIIESGLSLAQQASQSHKTAVGRVKGEEEGLQDLYVEMTANNVDDFFVISLRDVTQNYKTVTSIMVEHESYKKVNKDKNAFLVKLSNELKSPLHSIIGFSQAMVDGLGGEMAPKQEKYIKIINKNSNELIYLLDKILELSKTESNLFDYEYQIFDITNAMQLVLKKYEQDIKTKKLILNFDIDEVVKRTVFSAESAFKVVLENVVETSISTTDIGSISVKAYHPDLEFVAQQGIQVSEMATDKSYLMVTISDTGAGIAEGDLKVLFEPYAQLDRPNKKNIVRSIALASAKNIIKYMKGAIWVESELMQGTTYNIIVPIEKFV